MIGYFLNDGKQVYVWSNDGLCRLVERSFVLMPINCHRQVVKRVGMEPTIDPGEADILVMSHY